MPISTHISRRTLLKGAAAALTTPYISTPAYADREHVIHIINLFDDSSSLNKDLRTTILSQTAEVFRTDMPMNMRDSEYTHAIIQNFRWSSNVEAIDEPLKLECSNAHEGLYRIADRFETLAHERPMENNNSTYLLKALKIGMTHFIPDVSYRSLNVITDDDGREDESFFWGFRQTAIEHDVVTSGLILGNPKAHNNYFERYIATLTGRSFIAGVNDYSALRAALRRILVIDNG